MATINTIDYIIENNKQSGGCYFDESHLTVLQSKFHGVVYGTKDGYIVAEQIRRDDISEYRVILFNKKFKFNKVLKTCDNPYDQMTYFGKYKNR